MLLNFVTVYTKPDCIYCVKTKQFLDENNVKYKIINLQPGTNEYNVIVSRLKADTGHNTFPFIFINDKFIGGFKELSTMSFF